VATKFDLAMYAAARARAGDPYPLIGNLLFALARAGNPLSDDEVIFIREALEATAGKQTHADLRERGLWLIARQVDGLIDDDGYEPKDAVNEVIRHRRRSLRHIRTALSKYGKPRRHRD
jgi:hypothetical protein